MKPKYIIIGLIVLGVLAAPLLLGDSSRLEKITLEQYKQIGFGIDYYKVVELLGRDGILMPMTIEEAMELKTVEGKLRRKHGGQNFKVYGWKNTKGNASGRKARCIVMFANRKVVAKMQVGLK